MALWGFGELDEEGAVFTDLRHMSLEQIQLTQKYSGKPRGCLWLI